MFDNEFPRRLGCARRLCDGEIVLPFLYREIVDARRYIGSSRSPGCCLQRDVYISARCNCTESGRSTGIQASGLTPARYWAGSVRRLNPTLRRPAEKSPQNLIVGDFRLDLD